MKCIEIADMHWGCTNPEKYYNEMYEFIIKYLDGLDPEDLDILFIAGDIFDSKQYLYSQTMIWFTKFYVDLLKSCKRLDCQIIVIEGTKTHDSMQFSIIKEITDNMIWLERDPYMNEVDPCNFDVYYYDKVGIHYYQPHTDEDYEYKFLMIPEEYVADQEEYYKEYFDNHYDIIIGHGMIDKIWYAKEKKDNKKTGVLSFPVFEVNKFREIGTRTYFGHVHTHKYYGDDTGFTYIGPPSIFEFGKDREVGMIYTEFDHGEFIKDELIINKDAPIMDTSILNIRQDYTLEELGTQLDIMINTAHKRGAYKLRIIVNIQSTLSTYEGMKDFIITKLSNDPMIKLILSTDLDADVVDMMKESMDSIGEKTMEDSIGTDISLSIPEQIIDFTKRDSGKVLNIDDVKRHLDLQE